MKFKVNENQNPGKIEKKNISLETGWIPNS